MNNVVVLLSPDMLYNLRRMRDEWLELLGMAYDNPPLNDDELARKCLTDWMDDMESRLVKLTEVKIAGMHGGRTPYMFDDNGDEYYTTVDGVRHYTREEG